MLVIKVEVPTKDGRLTEKILDNVRLRLNATFKHAASGIKRRLGEVCDKVIMGSEEYQSLLSGQLLGELGVPNIKGRLDTILKTIKNSIDVEAVPITRHGFDLSGGMVFKMIRSDFQDILGLPESTYTTEKGTEIPWLDWLIMQGDRIIVIGYDVKLDLTPAEKARSRTGLALMEHGKGWRVPPAWSGTQESNFITKAFDVAQVGMLFVKIVQEEFQSRL